MARPPGVRLDSGGLGKGLAADVAAELVPAGVRYAISAGGDLAVGGGDWEVAVTGAASGAEAHRLRVRGGGVATSGIHERLWRRADGSYAHHLLDPATGEPAWTGLVAATAVAASALEAEVLAKTALLSGPVAARRVLRRGGGVLQHEDGRVGDRALAGLRLPRPAAPLARPAERRVTTRDPLDYAWWLASRSAGMVAYLLLSAAVLAGLAMALRLGSPKLRRSLRLLHEPLALLALGATAAHGLLLLGDPWLKPGLGGLLVPFASSYRPVWTGLGVLAAYLAAALSLTYYARGRLGARRWRRRTG